VSQEPDDFLSHRHAPSKLTTRLASINLILAAVKARPVLFQVETAGNNGSAGWKIAGVQIQKVEVKIIVRQIRHAD
jgi:hypothetical protein